jgi:NTP pyrophosphatase (non-canonical NTP hydrolase)
VAEMNLSEYQKLAQNTAPEITGAMYARYCARIPKLFRLFSQLCEIGRELDILKREIYYNSLQEPAIDIGEISEFEKKTVKSFHGIIGVAGEFPEILVNQSAGIGLAPNLKEEIGDWMWYIAELLSANDIEMSEVAEKNIKKLSTRYPEKFTEEHAIERNLKAEQEIFGQ